MSSSIYRYTNAVVKRFECRNITGARNSTEFDSHVFYRKGAECAQEDRLRMEHFFSRLIGRVTEIGAGSIDAKGIHKTSAVRCHTKANSLVSFRGLQAIGAGNISGAFCLALIKILL